MMMSPAYETVNGGMYIMQATRSHSATHFKDPVVHVGNWPSVLYENSWSAVSLLESGE